MYIFNTYLGRYVNGLGCYRGGTIYLDTLLNLRDIINTNVLIGVWMSIVLYSLLSSLDAAKNCCKNML